MSATRAGTPGRGPSNTWTRTAGRVVTPASVHLVTIVATALIIMRLGRRQWFYFDEWAFLVPREPSLLTPHTGHLSILLILLMHALRAVFGLRHYWPYLACAVVAHLLLAHLLWRVMIRSRVDPWIATALALLLLVFGEGAENIFWGFQVGYMGAMCCGVGLVLLVTRERLGTVGVVGIGVLAAIGMATSGTSLPFVAVAIALALYFRGLVTTLLAFGVPVALYGLWYVTKPTVAFQIATPPGVQTALTFIPRYVGRMFADGFDRSLPVPGIGAVLVVGLAAWAVVQFPRLGRRESAMPVALLVAALLFAALTAYSRYGGGLPGATSSRYVYFVVAACLPAIGAATTVLTRRAAHRAHADSPVLLTSIGAGAVVVALVLAAAVYNTGLLIGGARSQATIEQGTRREVSASLAFSLRHPGAADPDAAVDSRWAHALTTPQLLAMNRHGWIARARYGPVDLLDALVDVATRVVPARAVAACTTPRPSSFLVPAGQTRTLRQRLLGAITLQVRDGEGHASRHRRFPRLAGYYRIVNDTGRLVVLVGAPAHTTYCDAS